MSPSRVIRPEDVERFKQLTTRIHVGGFALIERDPRALLDMITELCAIQHRAISIMLVPTTDSTVYVAHDPLGHYSPNVIKTIVAEDVLASLVENSGITEEMLNRRCNCSVCKGRKRVEGITETLANNVYALPSRD